MALVGKAQTYLRSQECRVKTLFQRHRSWGFHLRCLKCNAERSMESAFNKSALTGLKCEGRRPWLDTDDDGCSCNSENGDYRALQRGASNLFYPSFDSALDIPPWTEPIQNLLNDRWDDLLNIPDRAQRLTWVKLTQSIMEAAARAGFTAEDIVDTFEKDATSSCYVISR